MSSNHMIDIDKTINNLKSSSDRAILNESLFLLEGYLMEHGAFYEPLIKVIPSLIFCLDKTFRNDDELTTEGILNLLVEIMSSEHESKEVEVNKELAFIEQFDLMVDLFYKSSDGSEVQFCLIDIIGGCGFCCDEYNLKVSKLFTDYVKKKPESVHLNFVKNWLSHLKEA